MEGDILDGKQKLFRVDEFFARRYTDVLHRRRKNTTYRKEVKGEGGGVSAARKNPLKSRRRQTDVRRGQKGSTDSSSFCGRICAISLRPDEGSFGLSIKWQDVASSRVYVYTSRVCTTNMSRQCSARE